MSSCKVIASIIAIVACAACTANTSSDSAQAPGSGTAAPGATPPAGTTPPGATPPAGTTPPGEYLHDPGLDGAPFALTDPSCQTTATQTFCQDVVYSIVGGVPLHLDLYAPPAAKTTKVPVIVYIHGGGWAHGTYHKPALDTERYLQAGYAVASVEYRLTLGADGQTPTGVQFPENLKDVKTMLRWIRIKAASFLDGNKILTYGFSAGAHLSSLVATTSKVAAFDGRGDPTVPTTVAGAVSLASRFDFHVFVPDNAPLDPECAGRNKKPDEGKPQTLIPYLIGGDINDPANSPKLDALNAAGYVDADTAPMLTFNGTCDQTVPYRSTDALVAAVAAKNLTQVDVSIVPLAIHGGTISPPEQRQKLLSFIQQRLGGAL